MAIFNNIISLFGKPLPGTDQQTGQESAAPPDTAQEVEQEIIPAPNPPPMFSGDRVFYQSGLRNQDPGWYFNARGDTIRGPFLSRGLAKAHLDAFIGRCQEDQDSGGRTHSQQGSGSAP